MPVVPASRIGASSSCGVGRGVSSVLAYLLRFEMSMRVVWRGRLGSQARICKGSEFRMLETRNQAKSLPRLTSSGDEADGSLTPVIKLTEYCVPVLGSVHGSLKFSGCLP